MLPTNVKPYYVGHSDLVTKTLAFASVQASKTRDNYKSPAKPTREGGLEGLGTKCGEKSGVVDMQGEAQRSSAMGCASARKSKH